MKKIFFCLLLFNFQNLNAQSLKWFEGSLVLSSGEVQVGEIALQEEHDLILFQQDGARMVYPAFRVRSLYFYDKDADINRRYVSLKLKENVRTSFQFYEVVLTGEVDVLRRKKIGSSSHDDALDYSYYIKYHDALMSLKKFKRRVYAELAATTGGRLENYVSVHNLHTYQPGNAIQIIDFYNRLVKSSGSLASNN